MGYNGYTYYGYTYYRCVPAPSGLASRAADRAQARNPYPHPSHKPNPDPNPNQFELAFCFGDADSEPNTSYRGKEAAGGRLLGVELPRSRGAVRACHPATRRLDGRTSLLFVLEHPGGNERVEDLIEWCGPAKRLATYLCPCNSPAHHLLLAD